jgi:hypothetical protein
MKKHRGVEESTPYDNLEELLLGPPPPTSISPSTSSPAVSDSSPVPQMQDSLPLSPSLFLNSISYMPEQNIPLDVESVYKSILLQDIRFF